MNSGSCDEKPSTLKAELLPYPFVKVIVKVVYSDDTIATKWLAAIHRIATYFTN